MKSEGLYFPLVWHWNGPASAQFSERHCRLVMNLSQNKLLTPSTKAKEKNPQGWVVSSEKQ